MENLFETLAEATKPVSEDESVQTTLERNGYVLGENDTKDLGRRRITSPRGEDLGYLKPLDALANMDKILTSFDYPPIPIRNYDWSAIRESYEPDDIIGHGKTEQEAIDNLIEQERDYEY